MSAQEAYRQCGIQVKTSQETLQTSSQLESLTSRAVKLVQPLVSESESGQSKIEQMLAINVLPHVKDINQMMKLVEESIAQYEHAAAANRHLRASVTRQPQPQRLPA